MWEKRRAYILDSACSVSDTHESKWDEIRRLTMTSRFDTVQHCCGMKGYSGACRRRWPRGRVFDGQTGWHGGRGEKAEGCDRRARLKSTWQFGFHWTMSSESSGGMDAMKRPLHIRLSFLWVQFSWSLIRLREGTRDFFRWGQFVRNFSMISEGVRIRQKSADRHRYSRICQIGSEQVFTGDPPSTWP